VTDYSLMNLSTWTNIFSKLIRSKEMLNLTFRFIFLVHIQKSEQKKKDQEYNQCGFLPETKKSNLLRRIEA